MEMADVDFVLEKMGVGAGAGKDGAADVLIFDRTMFVGVADPELVAVGEVVEDASGAEKVVRGVGNGLRKGAEAEGLGGGDGFAVDHGLLVEEVFIEREQEGGVLAGSLTTSVTPLVPVALSSRKRDMVVM